MNLVTETETSEGGDGLKEEWKGVVVGRNVGVEHLEEEGDGSNVERGVCVGLDEGIVIKGGCDGKRGRVRVRSTWDGAESGGRRCWGSCKKGNIGEVKGWRKRDQSHRFTLQDAST